MKPNNMHKNYLVDPKRKREYAGSYISKSYYIFQNYYQVIIIASKIVY